MEKIFFMYRYPTRLNENLVTKFNGQMDACVSLGYAVYYIEWDGINFDLVCKNNQKRWNLSKINNHNQERYYHTKFYIDFFHIVNKLLNKKSFNFIYIRQCPFLPPVKSMLKKAQSVYGTRVIIELPTYPFDNEYKKLKPLKRSIHSLISKYRNSVFSTADLLTVCGENVKGSLYGTTAVNISNGINVNTIVQRNPSLKSNEVHLLLLAGMYYWQGYDRLIQSLSSFNSDTIKVYLHFVGNDGDGSLALWKKMANDYNILHYIIFHGPLYGENLDEIVDYCDLGIGGLALFRKGFEKGHTLKIREYMARGLPFVYAADDDSIDPLAEYCFKVNNDDSIPDMDSIVNFALSLKNKSYVSTEMRKFAKENLSWEAEFRKIFKVLQKGENSE